jgi:hypothetical protein
LLPPSDYVIWADEKTSMQARVREDPTSSLYLGEGMKPQHEYDRDGVWTYLGAWAVHRARICGTCEEKSRIGPFGRLVDQVISQRPYRTTNRIFWVIGNDSSHRGTLCLASRKEWSNTVAVHLLNDPSPLNRIEVYFAIVQKKALTPGEFPSLEAAKKRLLDFDTRYQEVVPPFRWRFTRKDLKEKLKVVTDHILM